MVGAWVRLIVNSAVVAAVVVAAQLGAGEALGVFQWTGPHDDLAWTTLLTWVAFGYAVAVLAGALVGRVAVRRARGRDGFGTRVVASLVAASGAAAVIGLAWLPAREVEPPANVNPGLVISIAAGAGVLVGLVLAIVVLSVRAMAVGVLASVAWVWLLAIGAAVAGLTSNAPYPAPRVGIPDAPSLIPPSQWTGPWVLVIAAALLGLTAAGIARGRRSTRLGAAVSGFGGPALVAAAYLIAGPGEDQSEAYMAALLAVAAGIAASAVVAIPGRLAASSAAPAAGPVAAATTAAGDRPSREGSAAADRDPAAPSSGDSGSPVPGDVLVSTRAPVTAGAPPSGPSRPAWAQGSGPVARAYSSSAAPTVEPATTTRGTGWDADTLAGTTHAPTGRPAADEAERGGGLYRSSSYGSTDSATAERPAVGAGAMGQPRVDPHESWLRDLSAPGRHAAAD